MKKVLVLYYSVHGATKMLAQAIATGIEMEGAEAILRTVPPVSNQCEAVIDAIPKDGPPYVTKTDLQNCDGLVLGSPTRFGNMAAPLKYFIDSTSDLWLSASLAGKPASVFTSSSSMHGGQESTLLSMMVPLLHHGMIISGVPYSVPELHNTQSGGTPYGATHVSHDNSRLTDSEKAIAIAQGKRMVQLVSKL
ncbi:NAD(P)H:quinone oxidoreductase [Alteromonas sp. 5E99-2]|uniref:NAD(P)H:quinone oxidoreductase n=1 Tax=Alteromonas sp. 5E99-2 TaxID=2817683 RepID=UPI001A98EEF3|nr:NAD(P)H:quinone oxidoreductase [Alteromonas sp. 5E99-2]